MKKILPMAATSLLALAACSSPRQAEVIAPAPAPVMPAPVPGGSTVRPATAIHKAVIYRTSRPAADLVPVQLTANRSQLISFPAPGDLTESSTPIALADGWWLDRRGVGLNTAFTHWTYAEYRAMKQAPTPGQILQAIVPGITVTELHSLDMTPSAAAADTAAVNAFIRTLR